MASTLYVGNRNYSSWSIRASLCLRQSGLECREEVIPLGTPEGLARIREVSPSARVPVLVHGGLRVWDSLAIAEFLHELRPAAGLWPADPGSRAVARSVCAEMHSGFAALRSAHPMDLRAQHPAVALSDTVRADVARIEAIWSACRERSEAGGDFLFGSWSAADAFYAPVVSRFRSYGIPLTPSAQRYADAVWRWPAFAELVREAEREPWVIG